MVENENVVIDTAAEVVEELVVTPVSNVDSGMQIVMSGLSAVVGVISAVYYGRMSYALFKARPGGKA